MNAIAVSDGSHPFGTVGATTDGASDALCNFFGDSQVGNDIWYCYTATCTGEAIVSLCGSEYDTKLAVYNGCGCPTATPLACNDDGCGSNVTTVQSRVTVSVTAGQTYMVRVGGYFGTSGDGILTIRCGVDACASGTGDCFAANPNSEPGCGDASCCQTTCELDTFCCDVVWDNYCAGEATGICTGIFPACSNGAGACNTPQATPGCSDSACCNEICGSDPYCCLVAWDSNCVGETSGTCFSSCTAQSGDCFAAHVGPGCNNVSCCQAVCGSPNSDTFCCDTQWDAQCASEAQAFGCVASQCGNGVIDGSEECDDGNANNNDACTNSCTIARCGDGIVETGVEQCDDGNVNDNDGCTNSCRIARCGDGIIETGVEECDDGNTTNIDGCTNSCTLPRCGDGILQPGEQCDGASSDACAGAPCLTNCTCQPVVQSIPALSQWGIALVGLVLLIGAKLRFRATMDLPIR